MSVGLYIKELCWSLRSDLAEVPIRILMWLPLTIGITARKVLLSAYLGSMGENNTFLEGVLIVTPKKLFVGSNCNFARRVFITAGGGVRIGDWVGIGPDVKIWSVNHKFSDPDSPWASQGWDYKEVIIEDDVWIGANSFIMPGTRIGKGAIISACTVVSKSVPPYAVMAGNPGRVIGWRKKVEDPEAAG